MLWIVCGSFGDTSFSGLLMMQVCIAGLFLIRGEDVWSACSGLSTRNDCQSICRSDMSSRNLIKKEITRKTKTAFVLVYITVLRKWTYQYNTSVEQRKNKSPTGIEPWPPKHRFYCWFLLICYIVKKNFEIQRQSGEADNLGNFICLHLRHDFTSSHLPESSLTALFFAIQWFLLISGR